MYERRKGRREKEREVERRDEKEVLKKKGRIQERRKG